MRRWVIPGALCLCVCLSGGVLAIAEGQIECEFDGLDDAEECEDIYQQRYQNSSSQDFTIVTALFDLKREKWPNFRRSFDTYLNNSVPLLSMDLRVIAFVEEKAKDFVLKHRVGKENKTHVHVMRFEDLELYKDYDEIRQIMKSDAFIKDNQMIHHPEGFSPEYNILMNSKFYLMHLATQLNVFNTSFFYWMDMGYGHGVDIFPAGRRWSPNNLMNSSDHRVTYIMVQWFWQISSIWEVFKFNVCGILCGGFFGGTSRAVTELYDVHRRAFRWCLDNGIVDDDQTIIIACIHRKPDLFNLVAGDWFDVFKLFH